MTDYRNRRSASAGFSDLSKRKRAQYLEGAEALYGGAVRAAREDVGASAIDPAGLEGNLTPLPGGKKSEGGESFVRCPECGTTDRGRHADGWKVGAMAEMGKR